MLIKSGTAYYGNKSKAAQLTIISYLSYNKNVPYTDIPWTALFTSCNVRIDNVSYSSRIATANVRYGQNVPKLQGVRRHGSCGSYSYVPLTYPPREVNCPQSPTVTQCHSDIHFAGYRPTHLGNDLSCAVDPREIRYLSYVFLRIRQHFLVAKEQNVLRVRVGRLPPLEDMVEPRTVGAPSQCNYRIHVLRCSGASWRDVW